MNSAPSQRPLVLLALIIGCLLFILGYTGRLAEQGRLRAEAVRWEGRIAAAQQRQAELEAQLAYVRSEAYVHQQARDVLNLVQPGDELVILVEGTPVAPVSVPVAETVTASPHVVPNWQQWLDLFLPEGQSQ
jgi:cell division protein FtsB